MAALFLIARIAGRMVAIDSDTVDSVVDIAEITPIPLTAPHVRGLAALRSRVVTVVDASTALGMGRCAEDARRAVITNVEGHLYAMLVDELDDVAPFALQPAVSGMAFDPAWRAVARGLVERDGAPILVIDLAGLVAGRADAEAEAA